MQMPRNTREPAELLTRGTLALQTGCNIETIRYYEQIGLLPPPQRSAGGHRLYGHDHLKRLKFVRRSRDLGFTLEEIAELLKLVDGGAFTCAQIEALTNEHVRGIREKIAHLEKLKSVLEEMASKCSGNQVPECPIIDALLDAGPHASRVRSLPDASASATHQPLKRVRGSRRK